MTSRCVTNIAMALCLMTCCKASAEPDDCVTFPGQSKLMQYIFVSVHGPCEGACGIYDFRVFEDGFVIFRGYDNVRQLGRHCKFDSPQAFGRLVQLIGDSHVRERSFPLTRDAMDCECGFDAPYVTLSSMLGGDFHELEIDPTCACDFPLRGLKLFEFMEQLEIEAGVSDLISERQN